jgi:hypothetical protein
MSTTPFTREARILFVLGILLLASPAASAVAADPLTPARGDPTSRPSEEAGGARIADLTFQPEIDARRTVRSTTTAATADTVIAGDETLDSRIADIDGTLEQQLPSVEEAVPHPPDTGLGTGLSLLLATSIVGYGVVFAIGMSRFASAAATHR